jgi:peptidoglycan/xylan/chitin deacetylase (PgdA/CDA1 family)
MVSIRSLLCLGFLGGVLACARPEHMKRSELRKRDDTSAVEAVPRPLFGNVPYGVTLYDCVVPGVVALSFDDGPFSMTSEMIDMFNAADIQVTLFVCGDNGDYSFGDSSMPLHDTILKAFNSGHQIASHSFTHPYFMDLDSAGRQQEMWENEAAFIANIGVIPTYMRPPYDGILFSP